jgi:GGDEF domain-containing protein
MATSISSSSIGIALFGDHTPNVDELLKQADTAMYQSKAAGRNQLTFSVNTFSALLASSN